METKTQEQLDHEAIDGHKRAVAALAKAEATLASRSIVAEKEVFFQQVGGNTQPFFRYFKKQMIF